MLFKTLQKGSCPYASLDEALRYVKTCNVSKSAIVVSVNLSSPSNKNNVTHYIKGISSRSLANITNLPRLLLLPCRSAV